MNYKKIFIVLAIILIAMGFYYRDYIPTTRSDAENFYYYFTDSIVTGPTSTPDSVILSETEEDSSNNNLEIKTNPSTPQSSTQDDSVNPSQDNSIDVEKNTEPTDTNLPALVNIPVPFTPQAPFGVWDQLHEEACEEASLAMAHYFLEKRTLVLSKEADKDIQDLTKFINKDDVSVGDLKKVAENYYKHTGWKIIEKPKPRDIKKELTDGNILIVPLAGREIGNPYYKQPGPLYHMLVVSGYNDEKGVFITQDPGTKRGKNYEYKFQTLLNAIHDYTGDKNKIKEGVARILVVMK